MIKYYNLKTFIILDILLLLALGVFFKIPFPFFNWTRVLIIIWMVIFIPGLFIYEICYRKETNFDYIEIFSILFCFGVSFWTIPAFIGFRLHLQLYWYIIASFGIAVSFIFWKLLVRQEKLKIKIDLSFSFYIFIFISILFSIAVTLSTRFHRADFDTFYHLAQMRKISEGGNLNGFFDPFTGKMLSLAPYIENTWFFIVGLISYVSHVEVGTIYVVMAGVLSLAAISAFYALTKVFVGQTRTALLATILFICFWFLFIPFWRNYSTLFQNLFFSFLPYPGELLQYVVFPVAIIFYIRSILSGNKSDLIASGLLTFTVVSIYAGYIFYLSLVFISLIIAGFFFKDLSHEKIKRYLLLGSIFLIAAALIIGTKFHLMKNAISYIPGMTSLKLYASGREGYWIFSDRLIMLDPILYFKRAPWQMISLLFLPVFFWKRQGLSKFANLFLVISIFISLNIVFNPVIGPPLSKLITVTIYRRMSQEILFLVALFGGIAIFCNSIIKQRISVIVIFFIVMVGVFMYPATNKVLLNAITNEKGFIDIQNVREEPIFLFIREKIPKNSVISANQDFSYLIGAMTSRKVITIMWGRMSDYKEAERRIEDNRKIIEFDGSEGEIVQLLQKYGCSYIIIGSQDKSVDKYLLHNSKFSMVFKTEEWIVFEKWNSLKF